MRPPTREAAAQVKVSSPLIRGSLDSNESDPIDIAHTIGASGSSVGTSLGDRDGRMSSLSDLGSVRSQDRRGSYPSFSLSSPHLGPARNSFQGHSSQGRRTSLSRSVGSFVGSYEESLLTGRLSQTPSRPLDFTASIGVLGTGKCKSSLRCPPHLVVDFPAFFYSDISPYVGQIDLEKATTKRGYRIPPQGQLQIVIKNPNKTAVKLFLLPYDVREMPPLHKTFFRQKQYEDEKLRYAIHVQICRTAEGKYYIYRSQRVVFANRAPDGKENLKIVTQHPEPQRYTPWVPEKKVNDADAGRTHERPDSKEATFIGGSLLDSFIPEEDDATAAASSVATPQSLMFRSSGFAGTGSVDTAGKDKAPVFASGGSSGLTAALAAKRSPTNAMRLRPVNSNVPSVALDGDADDALSDLGSRLRLNPSLPSTSSPAQSGGGGGGKKAANRPPGRLAVPPARPTQLR